MLVHKGLLNALVCICGRDRAQCECVCCHIKTRSARHLVLTWDQGYVGSLGGRWWDESLQRTFFDQHSSVPNYGTCCWHTSN
ncbi:hypothetical protein K469DRAFT_52494 [Zopfia rhizophila CBS 207.26]|uniref:Secreted protein n=1 Tax=Zopfia rhizophila CBS 207.26 TaxID=1314779 RepID=A0A6A6D9V9_9PEZI|nr:hypothetical protein K469DRAFT_52494 [Zopfia rhizophila CBS 207.26]